MSVLIPGVLWFLLAAWVFVVDAWVQVHAGVWRVDLTVTLCLLGVFVVRAGMLPWFLFCAALGRAAVHGGAPAVHALVLGIPIAALFPLRRLAVHGTIVWQIGGAALLSVLLPRLSLLMQRLVEAAPMAPPVPGLRELAWGMLATPVLALLLRRLPPFWFFRELER